MQWIYQVLDIMVLSSSEHCKEYLDSVREWSFLLAEGLLVSPKESTEQRSGPVSTPAQATNTSFNIHSNNYL